MLEVEEANRKLQQDTVLEEIRSESPISGTELVETQAESQSQLPTAIVRNRPPLPVRGEVSAQAQGGEARAVVNEEARQSEDNIINGDVVPEPSAENGDPVRGVAAELEAEAEAAVAAVVEQPVSQEDNAPRTPVEVIQPN